MSQLVKLVSAFPGSRSGRVLLVMRAINDHRSHAGDVRALNLQFQWAEKPEGLFLAENPKLSRGAFSLRYRRLGPETLELSISSRPALESEAEKRAIRRAAEAILAMIRRGEEWQDKRGRSFTRAWGLERQKRRHRRQGQRHRPLLSACAWRLD